MDLSEQEIRFVEAYLHEPNATRAAALSNYALDYGRRLRWKPNVAAAIAKAQAERAERLDLSADEVVQNLADIARSNAGELIEHRRVNCRCCQGMGFNRQLTHTEQMDRKRQGQVIDPDQAGVFDPWGEPNPDCPQCGGLGESAAFLKDSRYLSPNGQSAYAGIKWPSRGLELVMHDRVKALLQLGKHLGMFTGKPPKPKGRMTHEEYLRSRAAGSKSTVQGGDSEEDPFAAFR